MKAFRAFVLFIGILFFILPVHAQAAGLASESPFNGVTQLAIGAMESLSVGVEQIQSYFLRIPPSNLTLVSEPISSDDVRSKLRGNLMGQVVSAPDARIPVNILVYPSHLDDSAGRVTAAGGAVTGSHRIGSILSAELPASVLLDIAASPDILSIWPDREFHTSLNTSVNQINAPAMWNEGFTGTGIKIAILDTGIDGSHPMLAGKVLQSVSFTGDSPADVVGHGTHVAGIAAGKLNGAGTYNGVAPDAQLLNVKVLGNNGIGAESWIIAGINYALNPDGNALTNDGADILNLSLGGPYTDPNSPVVVAVESAIANGAMVVISSGNCGPGCPSPNCQGFVGIETPGEAPNAITVGAVDDGSVYACFSSGGIVSSQIKPDLVAPGVGITSSYLNNTTTSFSGTSMAAPHVSGVLALLLQSNPTLTPAEAKYILEQSAVDLGTPGKDTEYGSGLVDASSLLPSTVLTYLEYTFNVSNAVIDVGQSNTLTFSAVSDNVADLVVRVTQPNQLITPIPMSRTGLTWTGTFSGANEVGTYLVDANVENTLGTLTSLSRSFVAKTPSTTGDIPQYLIPPAVDHGSPVTASMDFQNTGSFPTEVLVELQEWKGDLFEHIRFSTPTLVNPGQTVTIPVSWTPKGSIGMKNVKLVATFDDVALERDENVLVRDVTAPLIWDIQAASSVSQPTPLSVRVRAGDLSTLRGILHVTTPSTTFDVEMQSASFVDFNQSLTGLIETFESGNYSFTAELCDEGSPAQCTTSVPHAFTVSACSNPKSLIVLGDAQASDFNAWLSSRCLAFWDIPSQVPSSAYLSQFPLVYWDAGSSYVHAPDENAAAWLSSFSGNLVMEGSEIAFKHVNDSFMHAIIHADFNDSFRVDENSVIPLTLDYPHSIFQGLSSPLPFDLTGKAMNPDSVTPDANGFSLARWDVNGSGIVARQVGLQKHLYLGFSTKFLAGSARQTLLSNIFQWMDLVSGPDLIVGDSVSPFDPATVNYGSLFPSAPLPIPVTHYFTEGSNTYSFLARNIGNQAASSIPYTVRIDGVPVTTLTTSLLANESRRLNPVFTLTPGYHRMEIIANSDGSTLEPNALNNIKKFTIWVAPALPNILPLDTDARYQNGIMTVKIRLANYGGTDVPSVGVRTIVDSNILVMSTSLPPGEITVLTRTVPMAKENILVEINADAAHLLTEAIESDNLMVRTLYFCTLSNILVVNDDDAEPYVDTNASSASVFDYALKESQYCSTIWNQSTQGVPTPAQLNAYPIVIWTTGDHWSGVIDANDEAVLAQYPGSVWVEGNDVGFEHGDDNFMHVQLHADMNGDILPPSQTMTVNTLSSTIFPGLSAIDLNLAASSFPDAFTPFAGGLSAGKWNASQSALISHAQSGKRTLLQGFALDSIQNPTTRTAFVQKAVSWLSLASNQSPSAPSGLLCNGLPCAGNYSGTLSLACNGSVDSESNPIAYSLEATLPDENASIEWWNSAWSHRVPITITLSGDQNHFRTSVDLSSALIPDSSFWSNVNSDFSDVRFAQGTTALPYYRMTYTASTKASFWIDFNATAGENTIYLYFGNASASYGGASTPSAFFGTRYLVDDFSDNSIADWTVRSGSWSASNGYLNRDGGQSSLDLIQKNFLQRGSSFYVRGIPHITSVCPNSNIVLGRETTVAAPNYYDNYFGTWIDNACPNPHQYVGLDNGGTELNAGNSPAMVGTGAVIEGLITRTGVMAAFLDGSLNSSTPTVVGWADMNHWYPYATVRNHGGESVEMDDIYFGNAANHAYDTNFVMGSPELPIATLSWQAIGTHDANSSVAWNTTPLGTLVNVGLRCRATDEGGSGLYSAYFTNDQNVSLN